MFDPELWRRTKPAAISLLVIGGVLLIPASYVFFLAGLLLQQTGFGLTSLSAEAALFWSALIGSCAGVLAWMSMCLLVIQRRDIRIHRLSWHIVRLSGIVITLCLAIWLWLLTSNTWLALDFSRNDSLIFLIVLLTILAAAFLLTWLGHRNIGITRNAAQRAEEANLPESERFSESPP